MKKRNLYIGLTIICILSVIFLDNLSGKEPSSLEKPMLNSSDKISANLPSKNPIFTFIALFYTFLFFSGLINLGMFFFRKIKGLSISQINYLKKKLPLDQESIAKLIFLVSFLMLFTYFLPNLFLSFSKLSPIFIVLTTNLILQIGTVFIIFSYIRPDFFDLRLKKKELDFVIKIYTAIIPITALAILINFFLIKALGIKLGPSPVMKLIPLINTKTSLFLFIFQVIFVAPLAEELIFRGIFYKLLRKKYSFIASACGLSLFFALLHRSPAGVLGLFIISFSLCYIYEITQKISTAFTFHALHNAITLLFFLGAKI
ncbi:MAG: CPBP family intramembrane metalloprotease [Candidatus Omnitrophica bacterium]|nr:CPBP family intramembrane metalloprotease [Candidatus Omnitrophota bacterium]MCF7895353.1 CPBP family intramembrane metalloprotease [Candidatus Omnitrophota bacterium]